MHVYLFFLWKNEKDFINGLALHHKKHVNKLKHFFSFSIQTQTLSTLYYTCFAKQCATLYPFLPVGKCSHF